MFGRMTDVQQWLDSIGLGEYAESFKENAIDWDLLPKLSSDELKELGIGPLGHRKRILEAAASINAPIPSEKINKVSGEKVSGEAERRQLTVMFCDLVGSTALSEAMDPEEYREILAVYQSRVQKAIEPYEGYIARYMGDGLLVYFGYPLAHEEDPERAVRAGLDIVDAVSSLELPQGISLAVRVGIATGMVVVGDILGEGSSEERAVLGDTPNLAARLQGIATPDSVLIADSTRRLVEGRFDVESAGAQSLKGISESVRVFRATAVRATSRFEVASAGGVGCLLGRDEELAMLARRWRLACGGEGQVVLLGGEPGIGKSRLADAIREHVHTEQHILLKYQCSPYHTNSAFHPIIVQLERAASFDPNDDENTRLEKLEGLFGEAEDGQWLIAELLSLPTDRYAIIDLTPEKRKTETIAVLIRHLGSLARASSVLVVLEDVHWIDPSTRELFDALIDEVARMRVLIVVTHRPEFECSWSGRGNVTQLMLNRLGRQDVSSLVQSLAGDGALPEDVVRQILLKTDGIPLFVEELTKDVLESGLVAEGSAGALNLHIPSTIQDSLVARLDRLGAAKEVAQVGATIGREFPYSLVASVWEREEEDLREGLKQLEAAGLLYRRGRPPDASYTFKHALVRDAAYTTLLRGRRRELHSRATAALMHHQPGVAETQPELLAHHMTEAGDINSALKQWLLAGQIAFSRSAAFEAQAHLERGRALIAVDSSEGERDREELELCVALGPVYMTTKGAHAQETGQIYARARELSEAIGDPMTVFKVAWGQWHVKQLSVGPDIAITFADECLALSRDLHDDGCELQAHHAAWSNQFFRGEFENCLEHTEHGWGLYDQKRHADHRFNFGGHDPGACGRYFAGLSNWFLGRPDQSANCAAQATELARLIEHPFSITVMLLYTAYLAYFRREYAHTRSLAHEGLARCEQHGFPTWLPGLAQLHDWALVNLEEDIDAFVRMGERTAPEKIAGQLLPGNVVFLVDACIRLGERERGIAAVESGLKLATALGHRWVVAELYRQHAALLELKLSHDPIEVEDKLRRSVELAAKQNAKSIELRSATALARLRAGRGDSSGAIGLLAPIYQSFKEGFDTADLKEAKALISQIS